MSFELRLRVPIRKAVRDLLELDRGEGEGNPVFPLRKENRAIRLPKADRLFDFSTNFRKGNQVQKNLIELHANLQRMAQYPLPAPVIDTINSTFVCLVEMAREIEALKAAAPAGAIERRAA